MVELMEDPRTEVEKREAEMRRFERLSNPYPQSAQEVAADIHHKIVSRIEQTRARQYAEHNSQSPLEQLRASQYEAGRKEGRILGSREGKRTGRVEGFLVGAVTIFWIVIVWAALAI